MLWSEQERLGGVAMRSECNICGRDSFRGDHGESSPVQLAFCGFLHARAVDMFCGIHVMAEGFATIVVLSRSFFLSSSFRVSEKKRSGIKNGVLGLVSFPFVFQCCCAVFSCPCPLLSSHHFPPPPFPLCSSRSRYCSPRVPAGRCRCW